MENKGDFFAGVVVGTVVGTLLGVLFAPAPGHETRQKVAEKGKEVGGMAVREG
jgi:gas vesicle protein